MVLTSKIILNLDWKVVENEFNKFLVDNEITKEQIVTVTFDNNVIFMLWENNRPSLQQLNKDIDSTKNTPTYISSGCE